MFKKVFSDFLREARLVEKELEKSFCYIFGVSFSLKLYH